MNDKIAPRLLAHIAQRFKTLAEPARLQILNELREGEKSVTVLADSTGLGQANLSKHLQLLHAHGFVARRKEGLFVYYSVADDDVFRLCDIVCGRLGANAESMRALLRPTSPQRAPVTSSRASRRRTR